jgi:hypothetical protein
VIPQLASPNRAEYMPGYHNVGDVAVTEGFTWVRKYFDEYCQGVENCRAADPATPVVLKAAYGALHRLRDRYEHEKKGLDEKERMALEKVFEHDVFIKGLMNIRQIGEHVIHRKGATLFTLANTQFTLPVQTSAGMMFASRLVTVDDTNGVRHTVDHLKYLAEAERRIGKAIARGIEADERAGAVRQHRVLSIPGRSED